MIEVSMAVGHVGKYNVKCPKCDKIFSPKFGVSVCDHCSIRTPHPSDIYWILRSRTYYYSSWNSSYDN